MLHCLLLGYSFVGHVTGVFVVQNFAAVAEFSVLRMRAGICDSRVCCSFGLVCCLDLVRSEHFLFLTLVYHVEASGGGLNVHPCSLVTQGA